MADGMASFGVAICLLTMAGWSFFEISSINRMAPMFQEMETGLLPGLTRAVWALSQWWIFHLLSIGLLIGGCAALAVVRERLRANVYGMVFVLLLASLSVMMRLATSLPLMRVLEEMGQ